MSSPGAPRDEAQKGLGKHINSSTRLLHRTLNKLILNRLPLAVPPRAINPSQYTTGILHIAAVYIAFETLWRQVLTKPVRGTEVHGHPWWAQIIEFPVDLHRRTHFEPYAELPPKLSGESRDNVLRLVTDMHMPELERAARLLADIRALTGWTRDEVCQEIRLLTTPADDDEDETGLAAFIKHTASSVSLAPHVLLAHGWVMYMALFSGGRFIRATLEAATAPRDGLGSLDSSFWAADPGPVPPSMRSCVREHDSQPGFVNKAAAAAQVEDDDMILQDGGHPSCMRFSGGRGGDAGECPDPRRGRLPLDFLHFATRRDGEDLKEDFKQRLEEAERSLSAAQQEDIANEANRIFGFLIRIVGDLDKICVEAAPAAAKMIPTSDESLRPGHSIPASRSGSFA